MDTVLRGPAASPLQERGGASRAGCSTPTRHRQRDACPSRMLDSFRSRMVACVRRSPLLGAPVRTGPNQRYVPGCRRSRSRSLRRFLAERPSSRTDHRRPWAAMQIAQRSVRKPRVSRGSPNDSDGVSRRAQQLAGAAAGRSSLRESSCRSYSYPRRIFRLRPPGTFRAGSVQPRLGCHRHAAVHAAMTPQAEPALQAVYGQGSADGGDSGPS